MESPVECGFPMSFLIQIRIVLWTPRKAPFYGHFSHFKWCLSIKVLCCSTGAPFTSATAWMGIRAVDCWLLGAGKQALRTVRLRWPQGEFAARLCIACSLYRAEP